MNARNRQIMESVFGEQTATEDIRTDILFVRPYGNISIPNVELDGGLCFCVVRVPDDEFFTGFHWSSYGPAPSDDDPDAFVIPVILPSYMTHQCDNWSRVTDGKFITTKSGVIVLDIRDIATWEGYDKPVNRDYNFDRRHLERSVAALKTLAVAV